MLRKNLPNNNVCKKYIEKNFKTDKYKNNKYVKKI